MIRLRIATDGRIRGLWTDAVDWQRLGPIQVKRASHVEFDARRQVWVVREALPAGRLGRWIQRLLFRQGRVLFQAPTRAAALLWESWHFGPGGPGWPGPPGENSPDPAGHLRLGGVDQQLLIAGSSRGGQILGHDARGISCTRCRIRSGGALDRAG